MVRSITKRLNHVQHKQSGRTNYAEINGPTQAYINSPGYLSSVGTIYVTKGSLAKPFMTACIINCD